MPADHMSMEASSPGSARDKKRFADFVRIHGFDCKLITREDEVRILKEGLMQFGIDYEVANGIMLNVASERGLALESDAEHHIATFLEFYAKKRSKVPKDKFDDAVQIYTKLTNGCLPEAEVKKRVKQVMLKRGWRGKRTRWLHSRRWFSRVKV
ncbi:MAG: hypothetical protein HY057_03525 [Rhodospirillales bacterium]|nr:hypothetical protein [Rhodospirillales bacterium]